MRDDGLFCFIQSYLLLVGAATSCPSSTGAPSVLSTPCPTLVIFGKHKLNRVTSSVFCRLLLRKVDFFGWNTMKCTSFHKILTKTVFIWRFWIEVSAYYNSLLLFSAFISLFSLCDKTIRSTPAFSDINLPILANWNDYGNYPPPPDPLITKFLFKWISNA